ncbi:MAG: hypothetical protein IJI36_15385 [Kiritimatiellae bacterium]|nr:hypothetical protein [Kiritimatiellia bacterium]
MSRSADMAKVVPGARETIKVRQAERFRRDPKARAAWEKRMARRIGRTRRHGQKMP